MHLYLCLANKSGDLIVELASEAGFHSEAVGLESLGFSDVSDNPDTAGKPWSTWTFPCAFINVSHLHILLVALSKLGVECIPIVELYTLIP